MNTETLLSDQGLWDSHFWETNLCFLIQGDSVLLAKKKRGFGEGKWNGVGGKVKPGEENRIAAVREILEEIGVAVAVDNLAESGLVKFRYVDLPNSANNTVIYVVKKWEGEPKESGEVTPQWFKIGEIPFGKMWPDDKFWLPLVLSGRTIDARVAYLADRKSLVAKRIEVRP